MRKNFFLIMSLVFWLYMVIGFSDNWLFDRGQASNSNPGLMIHAFFAFIWFSFLPIQCLLVRSQRVDLHKKLGIIGVFLYACFWLTTTYLYVTIYIENGMPVPLGILNRALFVYSTCLYLDAFRVRAKNPERHKTSMIVGAFMLMEPAISRTTNHLFGKGSEGIWLLSYLILFGVFTWYFRKINWQLAFGFAIWLLGTANIILAMG